MRDRDEYLAILKHTGYRGERASITEALSFFFQEIKNLLGGADGNEFSETAVRRFFRLVVTRLEFVYISLDQENPYRIFKSLNSTGVTLSEADLIRNFVLMGAGQDTAVQDLFDDTHWQPLEKQFEDERGHLNNHELSTFFRDFLMRDGQYVPRAATFYHFERRYHTAVASAAALAEELSQYAGYYNIIRGRAPHPIPEINTALHQLRLYSSTATYPLLLNLLQRQAVGEITAVELTRTINLLTHFLRQRAADNAPTHPYARWFVAACRRLNNTPYPNLHAFLITKGYSDTE
jgi:uncharacterized protein with ParB-like and HNH nuclease domain